MLLCLDVMSICNARDVLVALSCVGNMLILAIWNEKRGQKAKPPPAPVLEAASAACLGQALQLQADNGLFRCIAVLF